MVDELRMKVATAARVMGMMGLARESTCHVSARIPDTNEMWIRCRGGDEMGVLFSGIHNVRRTDFDGQGPGLGTRHGYPAEVAIHGEIYRAHPEVGAVVHAHPYYALMCGITDLEYRPIFGGYDPSAVGIAIKGVPIYPRAATIHSKEMAHELIECMGERDVVLMKGHGITTIAGAVESATTLAIRFDRLSKIMWELALSGRTARELSDVDMMRFDGREAPSDRGDWRGALQGSEYWDWKHYVKLLEVNNIGLPTDLDAD
jgi:ribulose-5-phosphate 4-epimerase/fuculose-1-phosphate aldolase